jgi:AcrR family transcriptional regulator
VNAALDILISDGAEFVKIMTLSKRLGVSRSSFYWYFKSRQELMDQLLEHWRITNTEALIGQARAPSISINNAVCNVFKCVVDPKLFDNRLDFAIRDWARQNSAVRRVLERSDERRLMELREMFMRYDFDGLEAKARSRILYYMQVGYSDADLHEPMSDRLELLEVYLLGFTGVRPDPDEVAAFQAYAHQIANPTRRVEPAVGVGAR